MTDTVSLQQAEPHRFLLVKRGLYYAPNSHGYTGIKDKAGRYLETDADHASGVVAIHEDDAPDFSTACFDDLARKHLEEKLAERTAELDMLKNALLEAKGDFHLIAMHREATPKIEAMATLGTKTISAILKVRQ